MKGIGLFGIALVGVVVGCGDNGTAPNGNGDGGGMDLSMSMDMSGSAPAPDMTMFDLQYVHEVDANGLACGQETCTASQLCCVSAGSGGGNPSATCAASCPDGGLPVQCEGPGNCGGDPCCLTLNGFTPEGVSCTNSASACPPMFSLGGGTNQTRVCHYDGDCTAGGVSTMYSTCCHAAAMPSQHFCFSSAFAAATGGQVVCP